MIENRYKKGYGYLEDCQTHFMTLDIIKIDTASKMFRALQAKQYKKAPVHFKLSGRVYFLET